MRLERPVAVVGRCLLVAVLLPAVSASAQTASAKSPTKTAPKPDRYRWEIEAHVTYGSSDPASGGKGDLPPAGATFKTAGGSDTRRVTSWYFADGAMLLNDVLKSLGRNERLASLDGMLTGTSADQSTGGGFGVRVTREWRPHLTIEAAFELSDTTYTITSGARTALKTTSDSFVVAFGGLATSAQDAAFTNPQFTSSFTTRNGSGADMLATGALVFEFRHGKRWRPYVVGGGGAAIATGDAQATLAGRYRFGLPSGAQVDESDNVTVHFAGGTGAVFLGGGGLKYRLWKQLGAQADARVLAVENHMNTVVSTQPSVTSSLPADMIWSNLSPSIQFSTNPSVGMSSLSGDPLSRFTTSSGSGFRVRYALSVGGYFRF